MADYPQSGNYSYAYNTTAGREWLAGLSPDMASLSQYYAGLQQFGGLEAYTQAFPQWYNPSYKWYRDVYFGATNIPDTLKNQLRDAGQRFATGCQAQEYLSAEINAYRQYAMQFSGIGGTFIRWVIGNQIRDLENEKLKVKYATKAAWKETEVARAKAKFYAGLGTEADVAAARDINIGERYERRPYDEPPIPDWMYEYINTAEDYASAAPALAEAQRRTSERKGTPYAKPEGVGALRPLSAQAELDVDQLEMMAGYLGWGKAGFPTKFSQGAVATMADLDRFWQPYMKLSEKLFPSRVKLAGNWITAQQR